jgi:CRP-like cAMP-binding protein
MSEWHPTQNDIDEAARILSAMEIVSQGAGLFAQTLMEVSPGFALSLIEHLEREFALAYNDEQAFTEKAA